MTTCCLPLFSNSLISNSRYLITRGKKPATVNRRLVALQRFYKWAYKQKQITENPFEILEGVRVKQQQGIAPK